MESYPSIFGLHHKAVQDIFSAPVVIQEKIDGSQFNFQVVPGTGLVARSKGAGIDPNDVPKLFLPAWEYLKSIEDKLQPNLTYRGEVVSKPKHNVLQYSRTPKHGIILFDICELGYDFWLPAPVGREAERLDLEVVPTYYEGMWNDPELGGTSLASYLEYHSILGPELIEGIVIKSYTLFGMDKKPLMAKLIRDDFKEAHKREWKSGPSVVESVVMTLRTEARWNKAIQHLSESGALVNAPQDIGPLLKEINEDVLREEIDFIKDKLFESAWKEIARGITKGFPEWYKARCVGSNTEAVGDSTCL